MSAEFDPYHIWLGIPPEEQPPHHYRLLGLRPFESNIDVIEAAADRQMTFLRQHGAGRHGDASQKLLNEVSRAQVELLNPKKKAAYDERLRQTLAASSPAGDGATADGAAPASSDSISQFPFAASDADLPTVADLSQRTRRPINRTMVAVICGLVFLVVGAGLGAVRFHESDAQPEDGSVEFQVVATGDVAVSLDGDVVPAARLAAPIAAAPGRHTIELKRKSALLASHRFWIVPGSATVVTLTEPTRPRPKPTEAAADGTASNDGAGTSTTASTTGGSTTKPTETGSPGGAKPPVEVASVGGTKPPPDDLPKSPAPGAPAASSDSEKPKVELAGTEGTKPAGDPKKPGPDGDTTDTKSKSGPVQLRERRRLPGSGGVTHADFSADGTLLATVHNVGRGSEVRVWNTGTGKSERTLNLATAYPPLVRMAKDNARLFYVLSGVTQPTTITSWQWKNNKPLSMGQVGTPAGSRPGRVDQWVVSDDDQTALLSMKPHNDNAPRNVGLLFWSLKTKKEIRWQPEPSADEITHVALSPDGETAAAAFRKSRQSDKDLTENIRVWNVKSKDVLYSEKFDPETARCQGLQFVDGGKTLVVSGPRPREFHVIDVETRTKKDFTIEAWGGDGSRAVFLPGARYGVTRIQGAGASSELCVFGLSEGKTLAWINANESGVQTLALSPAGDLLASGDAEGMSILWDVERP